MKGDKKLLFHQICEGDFARDMQLEFERMQKLVNTHGQKLSLTAKITVHPHSVKKGIPDKFGEIEYEVKPAVLNRKSEWYVAEIKDGLIVDDGKTINDVLQEELFPEDEIESQKTISFNGGISNE